MFDKNMVLNDPILKAVLEQIEDKEERTRTEKAINELLEQIQSRTTSTPSPVSEKG